MKPDPSRAPETSPATLRAICGILAVLMAAGGVLTLCYSPFTDGWGLLFMALFFGNIACTYKRSTDTSYAVSRSYVLSILAICALPPLGLLLAFGSDPDRRPALI